VQVRLVRALIGLVGRRVGETEARRLLFTDYFEQTDRFFTELGKIDRAVVGRLETMDTNAEALAIAWDLGLKEAAADIERLRLIRHKR